MEDNQAPIRRRDAVKRIALPPVYISAWSTPLVHTVLLPAHAQTSGCAEENIVGRWQLELFGLAASVREINFLADGSVTHAYLNRWRYVNNELQITQGLTWVLSGSFASCATLSGTYVNIFTNPILGNLIVRRGDWQALKID